MKNLDLEKAEETRFPITTIHSIIEKPSEFQKTSISGSLTTLNPLTCMDDNKLWKNFK